MIRFVVGGAIRKDDISKIVKEIGGDAVEVSILSDMQAALAIQTKKADYYVGACHTGGGGALSMAIALLTVDKCATVSMPGRPPKEDDIIKAVEEGKVAFGFTGDHAEAALAVIVREILKKK
ncbi:DUF2620 domain-containing protein [Fusibacter ferrireducens]|uniref:DUF2620 domain-containing protein n=1 Tax=Fusibacter ferrireducens TaxID=2785058 RepID=A0ABR9ZXM7_9FIRM|nr:DUF2620 domain-containing protein [Fusibacter ferrireducens]MBF4695207.1 DUF2620 domain-containing protein [Fusibacter ferrireducens]